MKNLSEVDKKLKNVFAHIFQLQNKDINNSSSMKNIEQWDSLNHIGLVLSIEKRFNIRFRTGEVQALRDVGGMIDLLVSKIQF